ERERTVNDLPIDDIISISVHAALAPIKHLFSIHNLDTDLVHEAAVRRARERVREELPPHFVHEIERFNRIENKARGVLKAFDKGRDRLTWEQWRALEDLEEAVYVRQAE